MKFNQDVLRNEFDGEPVDGGYTAAENLYRDDGTPDEGESQIDSSAAKVEAKTEPAGGAFDYDKFSETLAKNLQKHAPAAKVEPAKMSTEDFRKATRYRQVTEDDVYSLFGKPEIEDAAQLKAWLEPRAARLQDLIDGQASHAIEVNKILTQMAVKDALRQYEPILSAFQGAKQRESVNTFIKGVVESNPALKGTEKIAELAIQQMKASGYESKGDEAADRLMVVNVMQTILKAANPNFNMTSAGGGGSGSPRARTNRMPGVLNGAGGSGAGGDGGQTGKKTNAQRLYS